MPEFRIASSLIAIAATLGATSAFAQSTAGDATADEDRLGNREIIVTAQRRAESVQDVPIAIAAFDSEMVEARGSADISDLNGITPNVVLQQEGLIANVPMFSIRGMSSADPDPNADPKISTIIDGVYIPFVASSMLDLFDVERVEVLKGPQGVLFGKNNLAGTINVVTRRPSKDPGLEVRFTAGSFGLMQLRGRVDTGSFANDTLAVKLSGNFRNYNGYARNVLTGQRLHATENGSLRGAIRFAPSSSFESILVGDWNKEDSIGPANKSTDNGSAGYLALPAEVRAGVRLAAIPFDPYSRTKAYGLSWTNNLDLGGGTLTAVLGYRHQDYVTRGDFDGLITPVPGFDVTRDFTGNSKSAEVRFVSESGKPLDFVIGAYAQGDDWQQFNTVLSTPTARTQSALDQQSNSYGLFALANWHPFERLTLSLGGRYSWDNKTYSIATDVFNNNVRVAASSFAFTDLTGDWNQFTPRVTLQYEPIDDVMLYANFSKGYKAGGFNSRGTRPENVGPYDPEFVTSWEAGLKTDLFDRRLRFNMAGFINNFRDLQGGVTRAGAIRAESVTVNIASARTWGLEFEAMLRVTPELTLSANFGYLNSRFTEFCADVDGLLSATNAAVAGQCGPAVGITFAGSPTVTYMIPTDNSGLDMANAPKYSASGQIDFNLPVAGGELRIHGDARYTSRYNTWGRSNIAYYYRDAVTLLNASIGYVGADDRWSVTGYVRNLTDETVMSGAVSPGGGGPVQQFYQPPREFGVELGFKF